MRFPNIDSNEDWHTVILLRKPLIKPAVLAPALAIAVILAIWLIGAIEFFAGG